MDEEQATWPSRAAGIDRAYVSRVFKLTLA